MDFSARWLPLAGRRLQPDEADAILEVAYRAMIADGRVDSAELEVFRSILARLRARLVTGAPVNPYRADATIVEPETISDARLEAVLGRLKELVTVTPREGALHVRLTRRSHLRALAERLAPDARDLAFQAAYAVSIADVELTQDESELVVELADALGIDPSRIDLLEAAVVDSASDG